MIENIEINSNLILKKIIYINQQIQLLIILQIQISIFTNSNFDINKFKFGFLQIQIWIFTNSNFDTLKIIYL